MKKFIKTALANILLLCMLFGGCTAPSAPESTSSALPQSSRAGAQSQVSSVSSAAGPQSGQDNLWLQEPRVGDIYLQKSVQENYVVYAKMEGSSNKLVEEIGSLIWLAIRGFHNASGVYKNVEDIPEIQTVQEFWGLLNPEGKTDFGSKEGTCPPFGLGAVPKLFAHRHTARRRAAPI